MLSYQPPFMNVGNLTIFRDDVDPETFYYANVQPSIVQKKEGPAISAYTILPESSTDENIDQIIDTSLSMEVSLKVSDAILERAKEEIKEKWSKKVKRLLPVTITDGKVYMIMAAAGENPDPKDWYVTSGVSPSIFGDNRAALVVKTTGNEAKRLVAALNEDVIAGHVYYELNILGIAPTFKAKMHVKWDRIYKHFEDMKVKNFIFYREDISNTLDDLKETSMVTMEIEELDPDVSDYASKTLLNELKTEAIKRLFNPSVPPLSASKKIENRIAHGVAMIHSTIIPGSFYILRNNKEVQTNELTVDLRERKAKKYPFYPQALLSSMIRDIGGLQDHLKWIKLEDLPFRVETVAVDIAADTFSINNIKTVKISCEIWDLTLQKVAKEQTFIFNKSTPENLKGTFTYTRQNTNEYTYRYNATLFLDNEGTGLPPQMEVTAQETTSEFIYFNPTEYFENIKLQIGIDDTDIFNHAHLIESTVTVTEKVTDKKLLTQSFLLENTDEGKKQKLLSLLYSKLHPVKLDLQVKYYIAGSEEYILELPDHQDFSYFIPNPFESKWSVELMSKIDWEKSTKLIVEARVWEHTRNTWITEKFNFTKEQDTHTFSVITSLQTPREVYELRTTVITNEGKIIRGAWKDHVGPIAMIKDNVQPERTIKATLIDAPDFEDYEIKEISLSILYEDEHNNIAIDSDDTKKLVFKELNDVVIFTHAMTDSNLLSYKYRLKAKSKSGDRYKSDWITTTEEHLKVSIPENIW
ncbi:hypothetical protein [Tenacibaculum amylolyticum]|uniref:hypothetical protein n=1 Tax=Tenacibaculum amylolyticum TaxID=104269 RepID=UPI003894F89D